MTRNDATEEGEHQEGSAARGEGNPPPLPPPPPFVTVRCGSTTVAGYAERLNGDEALVRALEVIPPLEGECEVVIELSAGSVTARGAVVEMNASDRLLRVSLYKVEIGGALLLAATLRIPEGEVPLSDAAIRPTSPRPRRKKPPAKSGTVSEEKGAD